MRLTACPGFLRLGGEKLFSSPTLFGTPGPRCRHASRWEEARGGGSRSTSPQLQRQRVSDDNVAQREVAPPSFEVRDGSDAGRGGGGKGCRLKGRVENWEPSELSDLRSSYKWKDEKKVSAGHNCKYYRPISSIPPGLGRHFFQFV